jgi:hypothetical protein
MHLDVGLAVEAVLDVDRLIYATVASSEANVIGRGSSLWKESE